MIVVDPRPVSVDVEPTVVSLGPVGATDAEVREACRAKARRGRPPKLNEKEQCNG